MFSCSITRLPAYFTAPSSPRSPLSSLIHRSFLSSRLSLSLFVKRKTFADFHRANCESNVASYNSITPHRRDGKKEEARDEQGTGKRVREGKESRAPSSIIGRWWRRISFLLVSSLDPLSLFLFLLLLFFSLSSEEKDSKIVGPTYPFRSSNSEKGSFFLFFNRFLIIK